MVACGLGVIFQQPARCSRICFFMHRLLAGYLSAGRSRFCLSPAYQSRYGSFVLSAMVCRPGASRVRIKIDTSGLGQSRWYEYIVRFVFGGAVTALTGMVAKRWGPQLAAFSSHFPPFFLQQRRLFKSMKSKKKERVGQEGTKRGKEAAGLVQPELRLAASG